MEKVGNEKVVNKKVKKREKGRKLEDAGNWNK